MSDNLAPTLPKVQSRSPTSMRYERVQGILEADLALKPLLGPRICPVETRYQEKVLFSKVTIDVTEALHAEGLDARQAGKGLILHKAARALNFFSSNGADAPAPMTPTAELSPSRKHKETADKTTETTVQPKRWGRPRKNPATRPAPEIAKPAPAAKKNHAKAAAKPETTPDSAAKPPAPEEAPLAENKPTPKKQHVAVEVNLVRPAIALPDTLEDFTTQIRQRVQTQIRRFVDDVIVIGEAFLAATKKYGQTLNELAAKADLTYNTITQYVRLAKRFGPLDRSWAGAQLPASIDSLVRLARLEPAQLEDAVKKGKVTPDMGRKEVKTVLREYRPTKQKATVVDRGATPGSSIVFDPNKRRKQFRAVLDREYDAWPTEHRKILGDELRTFADDNCS